MEAAVFSDLIDKTIFSIAQDKENMYSLTSALFQKNKEGEKNYLKIITSDGHRLTIMSKEVDSKIDKLLFNPITLVPRRGVQEIKKFCEGLMWSPMSFLCYPAQASAFCLLIKKCRIFSNIIKA